MIVRVKFDYDFEPTENQVRDINGLIFKGTGKGLELQENGRIDYGCQDQNIIDLHALMEVTNKFKFDVEDISVVAKLSNQIERLLGKQKEYSQKQQHNEKVGIHVSNLGLLSVNEVEVFENCCTDSLQEKLKEGWRIIAVCPQPDQRRPDYILGRTI